MNVSSNNIIIFPRQHRSQLPNTLEELTERIEEIRKAHIDFIMDEITFRVFGFAYEEGFDLSSDKCESITGLFMESLKAALYKSVDIDHHLHSLADELSEETDIIEETQLESQASE